MTSVTNKNSLDLKSSGGIFDAVKIYAGWLANGFQNLKSLAGNVINLDWESSNETFFDKTSEDLKSKTTNRIRR